MRSYRAYQFRIADAPTEGDTELATLLASDTFTFLCLLHFDTDPISSTYNHWICSLEPVSDEVQLEERSFVLYPNTLHFDGDDQYTVGVVSDLESIGLNDLDEVYLNIGVLENE